MFIVAARRFLEGERDYGEQALATPTLQRLHVLRGVVHLVLVVVQVQGVKRMFFFVKIRQAVYTITKSIIAHTREITYVVFHCLVMARIVCLKSKRLAFTKQ